MRLIESLVMLALVAVCVVGPAGAVKVYINPSDQKGNWSSDKTYCEADAMQEVARRLEAKLSARGFEVRNSNGDTMANSCKAANEWPADIFISLHTNARGGSGWGEPHGTLAVYHQPRDGSAPNPISMALARRCDDKCVEKFTTYGRGHDWGVVADLPYLTYTLYVLRRTEMPGTLVEGLFHDNEADTAVLKTEEGRDAYAQGVYEAVCDHFGWSYYPDAPILDPVGPVANDVNGCLAVVSRTDKGNVLVCTQTGINGAWPTEWVDLKGAATGDPVIGRNPQGRLQVFIRGAGGRIQHKVQSSPGSDRWNGWYDLGGNAAGDPVVGKQADGRLVIMAVGSDGHLRCRTQRSAKSALQWDEWVDLGKSPRKDSGWDALKDLDGRSFGAPAVGVSTDGRIEVFALDTKGAVVHASQGADGKWGGWQSLGGSFIGGPWVGRNRDGRIEVFAREADGTVRYRVQREPAKSAVWDGWYTLSSVECGVRSAE